MRHIPFHAEPPALTAARPGLLPDWSRLPRPVKNAIRDRLYRHQFGLCGYCEGSLGELDRHIEHVEPKGGIGGNPARMFDYDNLIASCQGDQKPGQSADSCGHRKDQYLKAEGVYRTATFISPREAGCDGKFRYLHDGRIVPSAATGTSEHRRAEYTINAAGLDCNRLRNRRRTIATRLIRQIDRLKGQPEVLRLLMNHYLGPHVDSDGCPVLLAFYSTRKQRFYP